MTDRLDEAKGRLKEEVGDLTGNEQMEREGRTEAEGARFRREAEGAIDKGVGKVQEEWGDLTDDPETEARGRARQLEGDVKRAG
jgi:uncharacterized protein YjbJ (UPF0337 family)